MMQEFGVLSFLIFLTLFAAGLGYFQAKTNIINQCEASYSIDQERGLICSVGKVIIQ